MTQPLSELEATVRRLDGLVKPIARRPVDFTDPDWLKKLGSGPHPLDEANIREEVESLLLTLIKDYASSNEAWHIGARALFLRYDSIAWAIVGIRDRTTPEGLRSELILFSLLDQGKDPRDAKRWLDELCAETRSTGRADLFEKLLREVAALSSNVDRYGWGSTRAWLTDA